MLDLFSEHYWYVICMSSNWRSPTYGCKKSASLSTDGPLSMWQTVPHNNVEKSKQKTDVCSSTDTKVVILSSLAKIKKRKWFYDTMAWKRNKCLISSCPIGCRWYHQWGVYAYVACWFLFNKSTWPARVADEMGRELFKAMLAEVVHTCWHVALCRSPCMPG